MQIPMFIDRVLAPFYLLDFPDFLRYLSISVKRALAAYFDPLEFDFVINAL